MALFRWSENWDPFAGLRTIQKELERAFNRHAVGGYRGVGGGVYPPLNVYNGENEIVVECEMPGIEKENIDLSITGETLVIKGTKHLSADDESVRYQRRECGYGDFSRTVVLPDRIDAENIGASMDCGILVVRMPKSETTRSRQVKVS